MDVFFSLSLYSHSNFKNVENIGYFNYSFVYPLEETVVVNENAFLKSHF